MYIYNQTINIEETIRDSWLHWMKTVYIPAVLATGKFSKALITRVVEDGMDGITFSVQFTTESKETLQEYFSENAVDFHKQSQIFEGKYVSFNTELEVIGEASNEFFHKK